jgi:hypothetical protein
MFKVVMWNRFQILRATVHSAEPLGSTAIRIAKIPNERRSGTPVLNLC